LIRLVFLQQYWLFISIPSSHFKATINDNN